MTNDEAITNLNMIRVAFVEPVTKEQRKLIDDTFEMAIKALEQQPCDDAISREAALEKMADYVASGYADSAEDFEEYSRIICQLPSITQKPIVCDDVISREAVIEWLKAKDIIKLSSQEETARKELKALPPVTPQQKYGKWIVHEKPHGIRYLECQYCNTWYLNEHLIRNSYCPNCGSYNGGNDNGNE